MLASVALLADTQILIDSWNGEWMQRQRGKVCPHTSNPDDHIARSRQDPHWEHYSQQQTILYCDNKRREQFWPVWNPKGSMEYVVSEDEAIVVNKAKRKPASIEAQGSRPEKKKKQANLDSRRVTGDEFKEALKKAVKEWRTDDSRREASRISERIRRRKKRPDAMI